MRWLGAWLGAAAAGLVGLTVACRAIVGIQDLAVADAGPSVDSGAEAAIITFTDDFDEAGQTVSQGWDDTVVQGGTVSLDTVLDAASPPASAHMTLVEAGADVVEKAILLKAFGVPPTRIHLAFDVFVQPVCAGTGPDDTAIARLYVTPTYGITVRFAASTQLSQVPLFWTEFDPTATVRHPLANLPTGGWHHLDVVGIFAPASAAHVLTSLDSSSANDLPLTLAADALDAGTTSANVQLGLIDTGPASICRLNIDNVRFELTP